MMFYLLRAWAYLWASPWTLFGMVVGGIGLLTGGKVRREGPTLEFAGGWLKLLLRRVPIQGGAVAMTLGHVVLGITRSDLDRCREHERVHVRQYERWGALFVPAYLACSFVLWIQRRDPYHENPFEQDAVQGSSQD